MARIRTIKPEFFRHEGLQDLAAQRGVHLMLVFAGLWGHCDKSGRFEWKPRSLKLDILPFLEFDMAQALDDLAEAGFLTRYEVDGRAYGEIPSFAKHQRISGKESQEPEKHPARADLSPGSHREASGNHCGGGVEAVGKQRGSTWDAVRKHLGSQEGKGREGKGMENMQTTSARETSADVPPAARCPYDEIIASYHATLPTLPRVLKRTPTRDSHIRARFAEILRDHAWSPPDVLAEFGHYFRRVSESRFLTGRAPPGAGRSKPFVADFDWLMNAGNFLKVIEGRYDNTRMAA